MIIGYRLRAIREQKKLSQGDIQKRTGMYCSYISRVENGHTEPSIETLERWSRALEVSMCQVLCEADSSPVLPKFGKDGRIVAEFCQLLSQIQESDRRLLLSMAREMADHKSV